jgi:hypothetical protein
LRSQGQPDAYESFAAKMLQEQDRRRVARSGESAAAAG